jgi:6-pyruvoyltetrahydropterin/6-carboxytetrahydropterin synthase
MLNKNYVYQSTKIIPLGSCAFRQPYAQSHCRFIHGYRLQAKFWFGCNNLDKNNWVVDFGGLKKLKEILETVFDHTTVVWEKDPELPLFKMLSEKGVIDLRIFPDGVGIEKFAEFCLKQANEFVQKETDGRCDCFKVEVWEHESNSAICTYSNIYNLADSIVQEAPQPSVEVKTEPPPQINKSPEKLNSPPLHYPKSYNTFKDPFAGTSWGNNAKR